MPPPSTLDTQEATHAAAHDRRSAPRYACTRLPRCRVFAGTKPLGNAVVINISAGGIALGLSQRAEMGEALSIEFDGSCIGFLPQPLVVRVVHRCQRSDGSWLLGSTLEGVPSREFQSVLTDARVQSSLRPRTSPTDDDWAGRRSSVRHACNLTGTCHWEEAGQQGTCPVRIRNVSAGGLSLVFDQPPPSVQLCTLELAGCSLRARLLYAVEQPGTGHVVGASFPDKLDPMKLRALLS